MKKYKAFITILLLTALILPSCARNNTKTLEEASSLEIYTSIYPIQYITEQIGAQHVSVHSVYPPGVDAHTYEPTSKKIVAIAKSDVFIYMGANMEGFTESAATTLTSQDVDMIELSSYKSLFAKTETNHDEAHDHGDIDPHIWLDPLRMIELAEIIKQELSELLPNKLDQFNKNYALLKDDLLTLDKKYEQVLQAKTDKKIIVSHAAYGYWEERYGIEQIPISGLSSSDEPSQKKLVQIVKDAKQHEMDYIIFEQNSSHRVAEIIQEQIGAKALTIHNLELLTENDIKNNNDYLSLMEDNLDVLNKATK